MRRRAHAASALVTSALTLLVAVSCSNDDTPAKAVQTGSLAPVASTSTSTTTFSITEGTTRGTVPATPGTTRGSTPGSTPGTAGGSTPGTALAVGACPPRTEITIRTRAGDKTFSTGTAWADVTLDASAQIIITNFDAPATITGGVWDGKLAADQLGILLYVTATQGDVLTPEEYLPVGSNPRARRQLNSVQAYSGAGREIVGGFAKADEAVRLTKIDGDVVCGSFDLAEGRGVFKATRT